MPNGGMQPAVEPGVGDIAHDTKNLRAGQQALGNQVAYVRDRLDRVEKAPSRVAVIAGGVVATILATIMGTGLLWGVTQISKVPALEERLDNVRSSLGVLTETVQELRRTAVSADGSTALRRAEIEGLNKRLDEQTQRTNEVDRNILNRMDRDMLVIREVTNRQSTEVNELKTLFLQSERRISDLLMRRQNYLPQQDAPDLTPVQPSMEAINAHSP